MRISLVTVFFILIAFSVFKTVYAGQAGSGEAVKFPAFDPFIPTFWSLETNNRSGLCNGFTDCVGAVAAVLVNFFLIFVALAGVFFEIITFILEISIFVVKVQFIGVENAPWWVNALLAAPFSMIVIVSILLLFRSGKASAKE